MSKPARAHKHWTDAEDATLRDYYGRRADGVLGRRLGRTATAVRVRAQKLGLGRTASFYTASRAATALGVSLTTLLTWVATGLLPARKAPTRIGSKGQPWLIRPETLEAFVRQHPERLDLRRLPAGWVREALRRRVPPTHVSKTIRAWTPAEDAYLINHRGQKTQPEMATVLNRSKEAVHYRLVELRKSGRLLPYKLPWRTRVAHGTNTPARWTAADDAYLRAHWRQPRPVGTPGRGSVLTAAEIGAALGRTAVACSTHMHYLRQADAADQQAA